MPQTEQAASFTQGQVLQRDSAVSPKHHILSGVERMSPVVLKVGGGWHWVAHYSIHYNLHLFIQQILTVHLLCDRRCAPFSNLPCFQPFPCCHPFLVPSSSISLSTLPTVCLELELQEWAGALIASLSSVTSIGGDISRARSCIPVAAYSPCHRRSPKLSQVES